MPAQQIGHYRTTAFVGHVHAGGAGLQPKQLGGQVVAAAVARRGKGHLVGVGFGKGQDLRHGFMRRVGGHHQHIGGLHGHADGVEVFQRVVGHFAEQMRGNHEGPQRRHQQGVAIGWRTRHKASANGAGGTGLVINNEATAKFFLQLGRQGAGDQIGRSAGRKRHHQGHRFVGPSVGGASQTESRDGQEPTQQACVCHLNS